MHLTTLIKRAPFISFYAFDNTDLPKHWGNLVSGIVSFHFGSLACDISVHTNEFINPYVKQVARRKLGRAHISLLLAPQAIQMSPQKPDSYFPFSNGFMHQE